MKRIITILIMIMVTPVFAQEIPDFLQIIDDFDITKNIVAYKKQEKEPSGKGRGGGRKPGGKGRSPKNSESDTKRVTYDERFFPEDYVVTQYKDGEIGSYKVWIVKLEATVEDVVPHKTAYILKETETVLKIEDFTSDTTLIRTFYLADMPKSQE